jgi:acetylglutamate kinase
MSDDDRPKILAEITDEELEQMIRDSINTTVSPNLAPAALDWLGERSIVYRGRSISDDDDRPKIAAEITDKELEQLIRDSINSSFSPDLVPAATAWLGDRLIVYKMATAMGICGPKLR